MTRVRRIAVFLLLAMVLAGAALAVAQYRWLNTPSDLTQEELIRIAQGTALSRLAHQLHNAGILERPRVWTLYALLTGDAHRVQAGEYGLRPGISPKQMLRQFVNGEVKQYRITFVEGWSFNQVMHELTQHPKLEQQLNGLSPEQIMERLGYLNQHPEGRFYPDSYNYVAGTSDVDILARAYRRLEQALEQEWQSRDVGLPYDSPYQALIMASIIEKETAMPSERQEIAGVFVRRLQNNMRLQTDPTVIYGLGDQYQGNLTRRHLLLATPYNTYVIRGLPPTPIAMPGLASIQAALHPAAGSSLYFVAKGDGGHVFSDTLEEHNRAVKAHQLSRSDNYRSTP